MDVTDEYKADLTDDAGKLLDSFRNSTRLLWWHRDRKKPKADDKRRILVLSPAYPEGDPMRIRMIDAQFFEISKDATWWAYIFEPRIDEQQ